MMKIALIQHDIHWEDAAATRERVRPLLERAVADGAELVVLPEMFAVGFSMDADRIVEPEDGPTRVWLGEAATALGVHLLAGVPTARAGQPENHALLVAPGGAVTGRYAKIHPFTFADEHRHYRAGDAPATVPLGEFTLGLTVCYDLRFPELYRRLAADGADVLVVIANWPRARVHHWSALLRARAIENTAYVIGVNRTGSGGGLDYPGASALIDPAGEVLAEGDDRERILSGEIDPARIRGVRERFPFLADRRDDLFPGLSDAG
jgi:predicted amidohydrolase